MTIVVDLKVWVPVLVIFLTVLFAAQPSSKEAWSGMLELIMYLSGITFILVTIIGFIAQHLILK
jgi:hypothetical protein